MDLVIAVAHAAELDSQFKGKRQEIRNLELKATQAMIAAAPVCDIFENKLGQLMAAAGPKLITATSAPASTAASTTNAYDSTAFANQSWFSEFSQQQGQYQDNQQSMGDATTPLVNFQAVTKVITAKDLGLAPDVAAVIDSSTELSKMLEETYSAAQSCKPLYNTMVDAESALNTAVNQWIDLAQQINPTAGTGPRLEANGMWVAVKVRRAAHTAMHTTIPDLKDLSACSGDLFLQQSIPNLFQGLANAEQALVVKSISEIMAQSQCLDIKQLVALDSGITWGMIASILAFHSEANAPLRKHLLEGLVMAGAPVLETTKVLGPTGLWMLTQKLLTKEGAHPDYWLLNPDSFLVSYGITVPSREGPHAVTFPICSEAAPVAYSAIEYATPSKPAAQEDFSKPVYDLPSFGSLFGNANTSTTPQIIPVDPEEAPLAYGYTLKELKTIICQATPTFGQPAGVPIAGPLAKEYLGKCTQAKEITDSYRGDHLGFATCSLPEMMANGFVCKTKLCDAPKAGPTGPFQIENPFGGEAPKPTLPTSCGLPGFQGIPSECQLAGKGSKVFAHATNTKDCANYKQLNLVADPKDPEPIVFEPMEIKGKGPGEGSAESQTSTSTSTDKSDKSTVDKPEKATQPESQVQTLTASLPSSFVQYTGPAKLPPAVTDKAAKEVKKIEQTNKALPSGPVGPPTPQSKEITTFQLVLQEITSDQDIWDVLLELGDLRSCSSWICRKKSQDLERHIRQSPYFQEFFKCIKKDAITVLKNPITKALMKHLRKEMLGRDIDPLQYDIAYDAMLNLIDISLLLDFPVSDGVGARTYDNNIVTVLLTSIAKYLSKFTSSSDLKHKLVNTIIHEYGLHVLSQQLALFGYDFSGKPDEGNKVSHPDHQLGIQLQKITGFALGYVEPPLKLTLFQPSSGMNTPMQYDFEGYKYYLPPEEEELSGANRSASPGGGTPSGGGSGESSGGGTPQKDCPPDSPCGPLSPCQLASLAAAAKCDMAMGKPGLKLIPGGGLTAPEPKLNKATTDWLNCLFPPVATGYDKTDVFCQEIGGQIVCTEHTYHVGPVEDDCQTKTCSEGYKPTKDPKTGECSCKPEGAGGDPWQGYRGGQDNCQLIICTDNSTHPCCQKTNPRQRNEIQKPRLQIIPKMRGQLPAS